MRGRKLYGTLGMCCVGVGVVGSLGGVAGVGGGTVGKGVAFVLFTPGAVGSTPGATVWKILLSSRSDVRWLS